MNYPKSLGARDVADYLRQDAGVSYADVVRLCFALNEALQRARTALQELRRDKFESLDEKYKLIDNTLKAILK